MTIVRNYSDGYEGPVDMFIGTEVERSPAFGKKTLFVVGLVPSNEILSLVEENDCEHVYFGANMSFTVNGNDSKTWRQWEEMILAILDAGYWATLDLRPEQINGLLEGPLVEDRRFIPMISVKLPYTRVLNYNTTIKIDDIDFDASNPGVWCWRLHDLMNPQQFTSWDDYKNDKPI